MAHAAVATRELLAPRDDVWAFVSAADRLPDWWPGIVGAQDDGATWMIEGDERPGLGSYAGGSAPGPEGRSETVAVEKNAPGFLRLSFQQTGYELELALEATAPNRTTATLTLANETAHHSLFGRLGEAAEEVVLSGGGSHQTLAESLLEHIYELCQTGADA